MSVPGAPAPEVPDDATGHDRRRLTRPRDDRVLGGVAAGLARHLGVDAVVIRLLFLVLAFAGGAGVLAYLVGWILIPPAAEVGDTPGVPERGPAAPVVLGLAFIVVGGMLLVERILPGFSWRYLGPALLIALGVLLVANKARS
jgi:phage shock protein C